jgi:hypothetical protein
VQYRPGRRVVPGLLGIAASIAACTAEGVDRAPASGPVDPSAAAKAALVLASCTFAMPAEHHLVDLYERRYPAGAIEETSRLVRCLEARPTGCRAVEDCLATRVEADDGYTGCRDGRAETSLGSVKLRVDCVRLGTSCAVNGSIASCVDAAAPTCIDGSPARCTANGQPIRCHGGREEIGPACASLGLACVVSGAVASCAGTAGSCTALDVTPPEIRFRGESCEEGRLLACVGGGLATVDCANVVHGSTCMTSASGAAGCGLGAACVPGRAVSATCDGDRVRVCNGGRIDVVDCKALGFRGCIDGLRSALGETYAACAADR